MNAEHITDAIARLALHANQQNGARCPCDGCNVERRYLSDQAGGMLAEIERLQKFERGDLIPGKVVTDNLAAAERWIAEEREACRVIAYDNADFATARAIRARGEK